nr:hydroxyisourate hydrolase [Kineococcus aurantiacus]
MSTHVLDTVTGTPAVGVGLVLATVDGTPVASGGTDAGGRARLAEDLGPGTYRLLFETGAWWAAAGHEAFHPEVVVSFTVRDEPHLHVPLVLSPFAYSTYRGS